MSLNGAEVAKNVQRKIPERVSLLTTSNVTKIADNVSSMCGKRKLRELDLLLRQALELVGKPETPEPCKPSPKTESGIRSLLLLDFEPEVWAVKYHLLLEKNASFLSAEPR